MLLLSLLTFYQGAHLSFTTYLTTIVLLSMLRYALCNIFHPHFAMFFYMRFFTSNHSFHAFHWYNYTYICGTLQHNSLHCVPRSFHTPFMSVFHLFISVIILFCIQESYFLFLRFSPLHIFSLFLCRFMSIFFLRSILVISKNWFIHAPSLLSHCIHQSFLLSFIINTQSSYGFWFIPLPFVWTNKLMIKPRILKWYIFYADAIWDHSHL